MQIFVTTQFVAFHQWEQAPKEVKFLRNLHRHIFKVKVWYAVKHNNRDKEFFIEKRKLDKYIQDFVIDKNKIVGSCEMVAAKIANLDDTSIVKVEVSEDGENGAIYEPYL